MRRSVRRLLVTAVVGTVITLTVGAGTLVALSKTVTITVDGEVTQVATLAGDVSGALADAGLTVADHDTLAPAPQQSITDGSVISLQRGRLVTLEVDGSEQQIWTTATTLEAAMNEIGRDPAQFQLSADRSRSIPLDGLSVTAETLVPVSIVDAGGQAVEKITTVDTVGELLDEAGIELGPDDRVNPRPGTAVTPDLAVTVDRVTHRTTSSTRELPQPAGKRVKDETLDLGVEKVMVKGRPGKEKTTYRVTLVNGKATAKEKIATTVLTTPRATVVHEGTKEQITMVGSRVLFNDHEFGVNWDGLAFCESTNNPKAVDPTGSWYGMFQFDFPTWASVGGSGNPADAPATEQLMRAKLLYQSRGLEPWLCAHAAR